MASSFRVALIQLYSEVLALKINYDRAASFIETAAKDGAQLAVLPEYHLTSWAPEEPEFVTRCGECAQYLRKYRDLAQKLNICIVPGTIIELHENAGDSSQKLLNAAYFIDNKGDVLCRYVKTNLWHPERPHLTATPNEPHVVFDSPFGPMGLLICWDLSFPEAFRELVAKGAKIIILPAYWLEEGSKDAVARNPLAEKLFMESVLTARAFENTCAIIFVNTAGPKGAPQPSSFAGLSRVTLPFVGAIGSESLSTGDEGMSLVDVDMKILEEAEQQYKVREDLAKTDWHYKYRHDSI